MTVTRPGVPNPTIGRVPYLKEMILARYPNAKLNEGPKFSKGETIAFLADCDGLIAAGDIVDDELLLAIPAIRNISTFGVGLNTIDLDACRRHSVRLGHLAGVNRLAVAELTICFMLAALRWVMPLNLAMRAGERPLTRVGRSLTGRVVGIHGCGHIGKEVVRLLKPFDCEILVHDIRDYADFYAANDITPVDLPTLLARSEVLSLHLPLTSLTRGLYDRKAFAALREDCVLINTCRGAVVDEDALLEALESGRLTAACFDAFEIEPCTNDRLIGNPNLLSTPHIGASTREARLAMCEAAIRGLSEGEFVRPERFADYMAA